MRRLATRGLLVVLCPPRLVLFRLACRMHLFLRRRRRLFHLQQRHRQPWQHPRQLVLLCHGRRRSLRLLLTLRLPRPSQILIMALTLLPINSVENTFNVNSVHIQ